MLFTYDPQKEREWLALQALRVCREKESLGIELHDRLEERDYWLTNQDFKHGRHLLGCVELDIAVYGLELLNIELPVVGHHADRKEHDEKIQRMKKE